MANKLTLTRFNTIKNYTFTFSIPPKLILQDFIKKDLLRPLEIKVKDDSVFMGNKDTYCSYHQIRGHAMNSCKTLDEDILDMIT